MRRFYLSVSLGAAMLLSGCAGMLLPVAASWTAGNLAVGKLNQTQAKQQEEAQATAAKARAERCYKIETDAQAARKSAAELRRDLTAAQC